MNKLISFISILLVSCFAAACGPTIVVSPKLTPVNPPYIALLPVVSPSSIQRERAAYLERLVRINLENSGYVVLDADVVAQRCKKALCEDGRSFLAKRYGVHRFVEFELESISKVNFLAGYYNALSGQLRIEDPKSVELYDALHTEREGGGVILESGQIIQAVINQINSGDEVTIDALSARFVEALLEKVPEVDASDSQQARGSISLGSLEVTQHPGPGMRLCAKGTSGNSAWLVSSDAKSKAQLREVSNGLYCGVFRFRGPWALDSGLSVELRSAFGNVAREKLNAGSSLSNQVATKR